MCIYLILPLLLISCTTPKKVEQSRLRKSIYAAGFYEGARVREISMRAIIKECLRAELEDCGDVICEGDSDTYSVLNGLSGALEECLDEVKPSWP